MIRSFGPGRTEIRRSGISYGDPLDPLLCIGASLADTNSNYKRLARNLFNLEPQESDFLVTLNSKVPAETELCFPSQFRKLV
jgi:hypothetical protein